MDTLAYYREQQKNDQQARELVDKSLARIKELLEKEKEYKFYLLQTTDSFFTNIIPSTEDLSKEEKEELCQLIGVLLAYSYRPQETIEAFKESQIGEVKKYERELHTAKTYLQDVLKRRRHQQNVKFLRYYINICIANTNFSLEEEELQACRLAIEQYYEYIVRLEEQKEFKRKIEQLANFPKQIRPKLKESLKELLGNRHEPIIDDWINARDAELNQYIQQEEDIIGTLQEEWMIAYDTAMYQLLSRYFPFSFETLPEKAVITECELSAEIVHENVEKLKIGVSKKIHENMDYLKIYLCPKNHEKMINLIKYCIEQYLKEFKVQLSSYMEDEMIEGNSMVNIKHILLARANKNCTFIPEVHGTLKPSSKIERELAIKVDSFFKSILTAN